MSHSEDKYNFPIASELIARIKEKEEKTREKGVKLFQSRLMELGTRQKEVMVIQQEEREVCFYGLEGRQDDEIMTAFPMYSSEEWETIALPKLKDHCGFVIPEPKLEESLSSASAACSRVQKKIWTITLPPF